MLKCDWCKTEVNKIMLIILGKKSQEQHVCQDCLDRMKEISEQLKGEM